MVAGLVGAFGQLAASPAKPGVKLARGHARNRRLKMAGKHVPERQRKSKCATVIHVQVRIFRGSSH